MKGSSLIVRKSSFEHFVGLVALFGANVDVSDCNFACSYAFLACHYNADGSLKFRENRMAPGFQPRISTDEPLPGLDHDFADPVNFIEGFVQMVPKPEKKERQKFTRDANAKL